MKKEQQKLVLFAALVASFVFFISGTVVLEFLRGEYFLLVMVLYGVLGGLLAIISRKDWKKGRLEKMLIVTGASAAGFFVFVFLHNMLYALATVTEGIPIVYNLAEALHVVFFLVSLACPVGFLVGTVSVVVLLVKKKFGCVEKG